MKFSLKLGKRVTAIPQAALDRLLAYDWPGNVRELRNMTERVALRDSSGLITPGELSMDRGSGRVSVAATAPAADPRPRGVQATVQKLWDSLMAGDDFWTVVYRRFKAREITRAQLMALIDRGLQETRGSYRALVKLFNMPRGDYKRFHAFLYQQNCNLPVSSYREGTAVKLGDRSPDGTPVH